MTILHYTILNYTKARWAQIFQKSRRHIKIKGARMVTCGNFSTEDPQSLRATVQNLVALATWGQGFVQQGTKMH